MPGYSGTALATKLGFKPGLRVALLAPPEAYLQWVAPLPDGLSFEPELTAATDMAHAFVTQSAALEQLLITARSTLKPAAALWISWPKKASKQATDITEDGIRALALPLGWVDIKVCAVSEVWSGLKLVVRKELR